MAAHPVRNLAGQERQLRGRRRAGSAQARFALRLLDVLLIHAVEPQHVKVDIEVERAAEALDQRHRAALRAGRVPEDYVMRLSREPCQNGQVRRGGSGRAQPFAAAFTASIADLTRILNIKRTYGPASSWVARVPAPCANVLHEVLPMPAPSHPPFKGLLKLIPGFFGIRLEEEPAFHVLEQLGDVEIRRYKPVLLASVTLGGEHDEAMNTAFKTLAGYIFGDNDREQQSEMKTPVVQAINGDFTPSMPMIRGDADGTWTVTFFLSNTLRSDEAPQPNDPAIKLVDEPASTVASLR